MKAAFQLVEIIEMRFMRKFGFIINGNSVRWNGKYVIEYKWASEGC